MRSYKQIASVSALLMVMAPSLMLYGHSEEQHQSLMARVQVIFAAARPAKPVELNGNWVLVTDVYTQQFLNGQNGPDHFFNNENGIHNADVAEQVKRFRSDNPHQLYWKMTFRHFANRVQVVSEGPWLPRADVEDVNFQANGDFEFEPDFGAEGDFTYRCRMESATRIVCLFEKGGEGLEFRKTAD